MKLLALETATEACSVALWLDGDCRERYQVAPRAHAELILPMAEELLTEAGLTLSDLQGVAFGCGPGAFTGVRVATAVAQALAFGADLPVIPVSTLATLARGAFRVAGVSRILTAIDARMGEVYWAAFGLDQGLPTLHGDELVVSPNRVPTVDAGEWVAVGSGWSVHGVGLRAGLSPGVSVRHLDQPAYPAAKDLAVLAEAGLRTGAGIDPALAQPRYLRERVVQP